MSEIASNMFKVYDNMLGFASNMFESFCISGMPRVPEFRNSDMYTGCVKKLELGNSRIRTCKTRLPKVCISGDPRD